MKVISAFVLAMVLSLVLAVPAFATGAGGAGREFGEHHADHARDMGGFSAEMNPGMHRGFAGWMGE